MSILFDGKLLVETLWSIVEPDGTSMPTSVAGWMQLCKWMGEKEILASCSAYMRPVAPSFIMRQVDILLAKNREIMQRRLKLIGRFASAASKEHLHFAVIKGMASASQLYGNYAARQSGDIDLLVHPDDIPKADFVLRRLGWLQPEEAFKVRSAMARGAVDMKRLVADQSRYPVRSSTFLPHVTNYFNLADRSLVSLELHDRFYCIGAENVPMLLSNVTEFEAEGFKLPTLSRTAQAAISLLSLYEDSEGMRSAIRPNQNFGLKACVDVIGWLHSLDCQELAVTRAILEECGASGAASVALGNCLDLFPWAANHVGPLESGRSRWATNYKERISSPDLAAQSAAAEIIESVGQPALAQGLQVVEMDGQWRRMVAPESSLPTSFEFRAWARTKGLILCWDIPSVFSHSIDDLALQAVVVGEQLNGVGALRVEARLDDGKWSSAVQVVQAKNIDSHAGSVCGPEADRLLVIPDGKGGLKLEIEIEDSAADLGEWQPVAVIPSVYCKTTGSLFRLVAGRTLIEAAEAMFSTK